MSINSISYSARIIIEMSILIDKILIIIIIINIIIISFFIFVNDAYHIQSIELLYYHKISKGVTVNSAS